MILHKLILHGFKSFADRTELQFDRGITGIVGPNGCGKSNIVDAIKWALGSQSPRSLRGDQMADVIFNGSGARKPAGMAQVDLVFDNSDHRLPTDQSEVTITRRLFRSGESEYLLNKQVCRLKDIRELFLDTGIGVDAYSVIEQGRVDGLLRANPVDRRQIFEEAAGISKYKLRTREAKRRLERVNQNLLRLQDIVDEIERRLRSIKVQAGKARSFQTYSQRLRELRSTFAQAEYHRLRQSRDQLDRTVAELTDRSTDTRTRIAGHDAEISRANVEIVDLERQIADLDAQLLTIQSQMAAHEERVRAAEQRIAEQQEAQQRCRARVSGFDSQLATLSEQIERQKKQIGEVEAELAASNEQSVSLHHRDHQLVADLNALAAQAEDERAGEIELQRRTAQLNNEIHALAAQQENLVEQKAGLDARDAQIVAQQSEASARRGQIDARLGEIEAVATRQSAELEQARARAHTVAQERGVLIDRLAAAKENRSAVESRRELLEELARKHEGLLAAAREMLNRRDGDSSGRTFSYVLGPVGELFEADAKAAPLVEAVLGEQQQLLIVTQRDALLADLPVLGQIEGRIQAFCLDQVPPAIGGPDLRDQPGFVANLSDWVRYPAECERLARHLFGRTYVVHSLDDARRLSELVPGAGRFVTLDGIVWETDGRIGVGSGGQYAGLITRGSERRDLAGQLETLNGEIAELTDQLARTQTEAAHFDSVQQDVRTALFQTGTQRVETLAALSNIDEELRRLAAEHPMVAGESAALSGRLDEIRRREQQCKQTLVQLGQLSEAAQRKLADLEGQSDSLASQRAKLAEDLTAARVRMGELAQQRAAQGDLIQQLQTSHDQVDAERTAVRTDLEHAGARIEQLQRQIVESRGEIETFSAQRKEISSLGTARRERREECRRAADEHASELRRLRQEVDEIETSLRGEEGRLHEVRARLDDLVARIREELSVDLEQLCAGGPPAEGDATAVEAEIADLRERIERLGNINLDAITEQEDLDKRHQFLTQQRDDLRNSEKQLVELIETLNAESVKRFNKTFAEVREHLGVLFKKLFGGGKADIFMENAEDVLESGIEIMARPPGKELQTMSLLSGGEKTMTAIALLMAVFKTHPSPFAILDEVDAALDEANNLRFNHVVQEFVSGTQFLIITHSKRTMSIGDVLYGITMQEAGVSKRISVKFENETPRSAVA